MFNEYDENFSYRFLYKLRNYAQHCGMSAGNINIEENQESQFLSVQFDRNTLLNNYDSWGKLLKKELEELPPYIKVNQHINQLMQSINRINNTLIQERLPNLLESVGYINKLIQPLKSLQGIPCIMDLTEFQNSGGKVKFEWIPLHLIYFVSELSKDN